MSGTVVTAKVAEATVTIDGTEHGCQIIDLVLTANDTSGTEDRKTLCGASIPSAATFEDRLTGTVVQDWPAPGGGLIGHTRTPDNRGKVVPFTIATVTPPGYTATGTVQLAPLDLSLNPNETAEAGLDWKIVSLTETYPAPAAATHDDPDA